MPKDYCIITTAGGSWTHWKLQQRNGVHLAPVLATSMVSVHAFLSLPRRPPWIWKGVGFSVVLHLQIMSLYMSKPFTENEHTSKIKTSKMHICRLKRNKKKKNPTPHQVLYVSRIEKYCFIFTVASALFVFSGTIWIWPHQQISPPMDFAGLLPGEPCHETTGVSQQAGRSMSHQMPL